jgi:hypothetical protein
MTADAAFAPRQCLACGQEAPPEAARCPACQAPLPGTGEITDAPRPPVGDFSLPRLPQGGTRSPLPLYTMVMLLLLSVLFGLATVGIGLIALPVLLPAFVRLHRSASAPVNPFLRPQTGLAAWATATGAAFLILFSAAVAFVLVLVPASCTGLVVIEIFYRGGDPLGNTIVGTCILIGLSAASAAAYFTARRWFPPGERP